MRGHPRNGRSARRAKGKVEKQANSFLNKLFLEFSQLLLKHRFALDSKEFTDQVDDMDDRWRRFGADQLTKESLGVFRQRAIAAIADLKKVPEQLVLGKHDLPALKKAFKKAVDAEKDRFPYKGETLLVSYAKYLIEYLEKP